MKTYCLAALLVALPFLCIKVTAKEENFKGKGVQARLLSEAAAIGPGQTFTVALTLTHQPGFHTYWENPGTVGMPTNLRWELPEGFEAGNLVWQPPERSKMFKYDVYGYETNATLLTTIQAPLELPEGPLLIRAKASWMACNDSSCNPGYHTFELRLPVAPKTIWEPDAQKLVREARSRIPKPMPGLRARAEAKGQKIRLRLEGEPIKALPQNPDLHFFSRLNHYKIDPRQKIRMKKGVLTVTLTKTDYAPDKIDRVEGVLRLPAHRAGDEGPPHVFIQAQMD